MSTSDTLTNINLVIALDCVSGASGYQESSECWCYSAYGYW
jgi:hypothetical protein